MGGEAPPEARLSSLFPSTFSRWLWGVPRSSRPWLPSCQVLFSDFPGCGPLSHLLPRALTSYPLCPNTWAGEGEDGQAGPPAAELSQATASLCHAAITQGLAAPCWEAGRDGLLFHPELVTAEIPATANMEG